MNGVNVIGNFSSGSGIGKIAHGFMVVLEKLSIPCFAMDVYPENPGPMVSFPPTIEKGKFSTNLICINPDIFPDLVNHLGKDFFRDKYTIASWWWEQERFPEKWHDRFPLVDEIWTGSDFSHRAIARASSVPVFLIPPLVSKALYPADTTLPLSFNPNEFVFLQSFDYFSLMARKNPLATVLAFQKAFGEDPNVRLIMKTINADKAPDAQSVLAQAGDGSKFTLIDAHFTDNQMNALLSRCDCYVSLHHCEGFGLPLASTLLNEIPVIATGWSGNTEFMNEQNSFLVDYEMVELKEDVGPFEAGTRWADPSITHAAQIMQEVKNDYGLAKQKARKASKQIQENYGVEAVARCVQARISELDNRLPGITQ